MIQFECMRKTCEESKAETRYEVWFQEATRVHLDRRPGKMGADNDWKRYEVSKAQYEKLTVGRVYGLTEIV